MSRVLVLTTDFDGTGGIQRYTRTLLRCLRDIPDLEVAVRSLDTERGLHRRLLLAIFSLAWLWRKRQGSVVICTHVGIGVLALIGGLVTRNPYVVIVYGVEIWGPASRLKAHVLTRAHRVWAISQFTAQKIREHYPDAADVVTILAGIEKVFFQDVSPPRRVSRLITVARLDDLYYKGLDGCVEAVGRLTERGLVVEYHIVGDGPDMARLGELVERRGLGGCITLHGRVADDVLRNLYSLSDVALLVSRFQAGENPQGEGLGLVPLEAGAAGIPSVVSSADASGETIFFGRTGAAATPGDAEAIADAVMKVIRDFSGVNERIKIRNLVQTEFGIDRFCARVREAFRDLGHS